MMALYAGRAHAMSRPVRSAGSSVVSHAQRGQLRQQFIMRAVRPQAEDEDCGNINDYCALDDEGRIKKMTLGEKEQAFLEAMSSFYYDGKPELTDEEFDLLKDELIWSGSQVVVLSSAEKKFLEAQMAFNKGKPIMSDKDFDELKLKLKQEGSIAAVQGARCSLRSRKMYADAEVDYLRMVGLNIPAAIVVLLGLFSVDDLTGFEVTKLIELPEPFGIIVLWGVVFPFIYVVANAITNFVFRDALVLKADCPNCGTKNTTYFGDIFTVAGNRSANTITCSNCQSKLVFNAMKRQVVVEEVPEQKTPEKIAA